MLVSHTPPFGRGDGVGHMNVGCEELLDEVQTRIRPTLHVFGHVHEGYGQSTDGVTTFVNASACTHDYEPVNPPIVFDLVSPRRLSDSVDTAVEATDEKALSYSRLLHEQLRVCSQKPPFIAQTVAAPANGLAKCDATTKSQLRAFRVEGTTADLLFESTLRMRPVKHSQQRALRYLFTQGFQNLASNYTDGESSNGDVDDAASGPTDTSSEAADDASADGDEHEDDAPNVRQRRRQLTMRRVTVAVLNDLSESKEMTGPDREHLEQASIASESLIDSIPSTADGSKAPARRRRDKTLRKREVVTRLSTLLEEPGSTETKSTEAGDPTGSLTKQTAVQEVAVETVATVQEVVETPPAPPAPVEVECVLCKYSVPGHVHPGRVTAPPPAPAPVAPVAAVTAPSENALSPKQPGTDASEDEARSRTAAKRLSSWF